MWAAFRLFQWCVAGSDALMTIGDDCFESARVTCLRKQSSPLNREETGRTPGYRSCIRIKAPSRLVRVFVTVQASDLCISPNMRIPYVFVQQRHAIYNCTWTWIAV